MGDIGANLNYVLNGQQAATNPLPGLQEGLVVSAGTAGVRVTVPAYHPDFAFGPCKFVWDGPGPLPPVNNPCLVAFPGVDLSNPWIVAWGPTPAGGLVSLAGQPLAPTGATAATRYVGGTPAGPPTAGSFAVGDFVVDQTGTVWICTAAGTPGTWTVPNRRPTGDIETTLRTTPKPNTLMLNGQTVSRTTYPTLWAWAQAQGLVVTGLFTVGDGSTTFGLPDFRGRVLRGVAATGEAIGAQVGADSHTLAITELPSHNHSITVNDHNTHAHGGQTTHDYGHTGHFPGDSYLVPAGTTYGLAAWNSAGNYNVPHVHDIGTDQQPLSSHVVNQTNVGGGNPIDMRQASAGVNYLVWV